MTSLAELQISDTMKDLKDALVVIVTTSPLNSVILLVQNTDGSQIITVDCIKFSQTMIPIAAVAPDVAPLLEQINTVSSTCYAAICSKCLFFHTYW